MRKVNLLIAATSILLFAASCSTESDPEKRLTVPPVVKSATEVTSTSFVANWEAVAGAKHYTIEVSTNVEFTAPVAEYYDVQVNGTSTTISGLSESSKYFYRVSAGNGQGDTEFSKVMNAREINKSLLYNILWYGDEVKSNMELTLMDIKFSTTSNAYTGGIGDFVVSTGTWQWQDNSNVMAVTSTSGSFNLTWVDAGETYCVAYSSALTTDLVYYSK